MKELMDRTLGRPTQAIVTEDDAGNRGPIGLPVAAREWQPLMGTGIASIDKRLGVNGGKIGNNGNEAGNNGNGGNGKSHD